MKRTLRLRSETLTDLSADELLAVAGGAATYECSAVKCPTLDYCEIPTLPVRTCFPPEV